MAGDDLRTRLTLDNSQFRAGMREAASMGGATASRLARAFLSPTAAIAGIGVAAVIGARKASAAFRDFQWRMNEIRVLIDPMRVSFEKLSKDVLNFSKTMGFSIQDTTDAFYQAISAGQDAANMSGFMKTAADLATAGYVSLAESVDVLTTAVNSYGSANLSAEDAADILLTTVKLGKTRMGELAGTMGRLTPIAASLGIDFEDLAASIATTTKAGIFTQISVTGLRALIMGIVTPTEDAAAAARRLGVDWTAQGLAAYGLTGVLEQLYRAELKHPGAITSIVTEARALSVATRLASKEGIEELRRAFDELSNSMGTTERNADEVRKTLEFMKRQMQSEWQVALIDAGESLQDLDRQLMEIEHRLRGLLLLPEVLGAAIGKAYAKATMPGVVKATDKTWYERHYPTPEYTGAEQSQIPWRGGYERKPWTPFAGGKEAGKAADQMREAERKAKELARRTARARRDAQVKYENEEADLYERLAQLAEAGMKKITGIWKREYDARLKAAEDAYRRIDELQRERIRERERAEERVFEWGLEGKEPKKRARAYRERAGELAGGARRVRDPEEQLRQMRRAQEMLERAISLEPKKGRRRSMIEEYQEVAAAIDRIQARRQGALRDEAEEQKRAAEEIAARADNFRKRIEQAMRALADGRLEHAQGLVRSMYRDFGSIVGLLAKPKEITVRTEQAKKALEDLLETLTKGGSFKVTVEPFEPIKKALGGFIGRYARGTRVTIMGYSDAPRQPRRGALAGVGRDVVPALLSPGEFVVNRLSAMRHAGLLERINQARGRDVAGIRGGEAGTTIVLNLNAARVTPEYIRDQVAPVLRREIARGRA